MKNRLYLLWALILGALLSLAYPSFNLWWSAPVPLLFYFSILNARVQAGRRSSLFTFLFWLAFFFASLVWILDFLHTYGGVPWLLTPLPHLFLCSVLAIFMTMGFWAARMFPKSWFWWIYPLGIAFGEWIKAHIIWGGFPWNTLVVPLTHVPILLQPASLVGAHGLTALIALFLSGLLIMAQKRRFIWAWGVLFAGMACYSTVMFHIPDSGNTRRVAMVQTDLDERARFYDGDNGTGILQALDFSHQALGQKPDLLLWPESVFIWEYGVDSGEPRRAALFGQMEAISQTCPLLIVANRYENDRAYNSAQFLRDGRVEHIYRKQRLVPFGEFLPLRALARRLGLIRVARSIDDFSPGTEVGIFHGAFPFGTSICFEAVFPQLVRAEVLQGAELLVGLTNDAWYGSGGAAEQHFRLAILRCVEVHRPLARAALTGISGFVDSHGRILQTRPLGQRGWMVRDLSLEKDLTPYARMGDAVPIWFGIAACGMLLWNVAARLRRRKASPPPRASH